MRSVVIAVFLGLSSVALGEDSVEKEAVAPGVKESYNWAEIEALRELFSFGEAPDGAASPSTRAASGDQRVFEPLTSAGDLQSNILVGTANFLFDRALEEVSVFVTDQVVRTACYNGFSLASGPSDALNLPDGNVLFPIAAIMPRSCGVLEDVQFEQLIASPETLAYAGRQDLVMLPRTAALLGVVSALHGAESAAVRVGRCERKFYTGNDKPLKRCLQEIPGSAVGSVLESYLKARRGSPDGALLSLQDIQTSPARVALLDAVADSGVFKHARDESKVAANVAFLFAAFARVGELAMQGADPFEAMGAWTSEDKLKPEKLAESYPTAGLNGFDSPYRLVWETVDLVLFVKDSVVSAIQTLDNADKADVAAKDALAAAEAALDAVPKADVDAGKPNAKDAEAIVKDAKAKAQATAAYEDKAVIDLASVMIEFLDRGLIKHFNDGSHSHVCRFDLLGTSVSINVKDEKVCNGIQSVITALPSWYAAGDALDVHGKELKVLLADSKVEQAVKAAATARYAQEVIALVRQPIAVLAEFDGKGVVPTDALDKAMTGLSTAFKVIAAAADKDIGQALSASLDLLKLLVPRWDDVVPEPLSQTVAMVVSVGNAKSAADVEGALKAWAAPVGSYKMKHEGTGISGGLNAYVGAFAGGECLPGANGQCEQDEVSSDRDDWKGHFAPVASIGAEFGGRFRLGRQHQTSGYIGLHVPVIDLGQLIGQRLEQKDAEADPAKVNFGEVLAPGGYVVLAPWKAPFAVGLGASYMPPLNGVRDDGGVRVGGFLAVDIPLVHLRAGNASAKGEGHEANGH